MGHQKRDSVVTWQLLMLLLKWMNEWVTLSASDTISREHPWMDLPLLASMEDTGVWAFAGSFMAFCAGSVLGSWGGSGKAGSLAGGGASSAATDAASLAMERVVILPLRRPWLLAVFLPRGVFCSFPSSSSPPSHLSLSLPMSLWYKTGKAQL